MIVQANNFDIEQIADSGQCFRWHRIGDYEYDIVAFGKVLRIRQDGDIIAMNCTEEEFGNYWYDYFDLETDYATIQQQLSRDTIVARAIESGKGIRILRQEIFETLVSFIISQRKSIPAIRTCIDKLCRTAGTYIGGYFAFPTREQMLAMTNGQWRSCGFGYRECYLRRLCELEIDYEQLAAMDDDLLLHALKKIQGVGNKVASCVMLFAFHRLNAFPIDVWMQRVLEDVYYGDYDASLHYPYNGIAQQYLFVDARKKNKTHEGE